VARVVIFDTRARHAANQAAADFVREILRQIQFRARVRVSHGPYTTGRLAQSIERHGPTFDFDRVSGYVGSNLHYASIVEDGSGLYGPHRSTYLIRPRGAHKLRFYWRKVGRIVSLDMVNHPGQRGKNYLQEAAESVARRHRMIFIVRQL
jgi:hypothetical protein